MHRSSNVFPSTWPAINLSKEVPIWRNFTNFSVTANANEVLRFNFTKFSVKSNANEVVTFNFTIFSVKSNTTSQVLWKSTIKWDHAQKFPWNQLFSNFFSKMLISRNFPVKMMIVFLTTFPHYEHYMNLTYFSV